MMAMAKKILVIEDDPAILNPTLEFLSTEGFDVVGAENGDLGLEQARKYLPDLIISDIMMPGLDGLEVLAELRKDPATATIPFIFLTARAERADLRHGMTLGADDYLPKPFAIAELLAAIHARLDKQAALASLSERKLEDLRQTLLLTLPHELRTPLTGILGYAEFIASDAHTLEPERIVEMAQRISKGGRRLYRLIENYLAYAQLEIVKTKPEWIEALRSQCTGHPQLVVRDQATLKAKQVNREADLVLSSEAAPPVQISEHYLTKIVQELVDNAFKFSRAGQSVYAVATSDPQRFSLRVTDRGRGMTRQQIADIGAYIQFERGRYEQQGSGLGLVIVKRLAELHGGELTIDSQPEQQTVVSVTLPLGPQDCGTHPDHRES
jgi:two-component system, sensor histidine kinase and response regulator